MSDELNAKMQARLVEAQAGLVMMSKAIDGLIQLVHQPPGDQPDPGDTDGWPLLVPSTTKWLHIQWPNVFGPRNGWMNYSRWTQFCKDLGYGQFWNNMYGPRIGEHHDGLLTPARLESALGILEDTGVPVCIYTAIKTTAGDLVWGDHALTNWLPFCKRIRDATGGPVEVSIDAASGHLTIAREIANAFAEHDIRVRVEASVRKAGGGLDLGVPQDMLVQHLQPSRGFLGETMVQRVANLPHQPLAGVASLWCLNRDWDVLSDDDQRQIVALLNDRGWGMILTPGDAEKYDV